MSKHYWPSEEMAFDSIMLVGGGLVKAAFKRHGSLLRLLTALQPLYLVTSLVQYRSCSCSCSCISFKYVHYLKWQNGMHVTHGSVRVVLTGLKLQRGSTCCRGPCPRGQSSRYRSTLRGRQRFF